MTYQLQGLPRNELSICNLKKKITISLFPLRQNLHFENYKITSYQRGFIAQLEELRTGNAKVMRPSRPDSCSRLTLQLLHNCKDHTFHSNHLSF